jgi:hypothetical protein
LDNAISRAGHDVVASGLTGPRIGTRTDQRWLEWAAGFFAVCVLVHNADHLRRGATALHADVFWSGVLALGMETALVVLVFARHRLAPAVAVVGGFGLAAGYLVVHFTPARGWLSDSLLSGLSAGRAVSIVAAGLETISAAILAGVALGIVVRRGAVPRLNREAAVPWRRAWLHPVTLTLVAGNAIILLGSLLQRAAGPGV